MDETVKSFHITQKIAARLVGRRSDITITVGIPAYKHAQYINECLSELMKCEYRAAIEVILIDDCSPDATIDKAVETLTASDLAFSVYRNEVNQGLSYGLDFLLAAATGRYFLACASDDVIIGSALDQLISKIEHFGGPTSFEICGARYTGSGDGLVYNAAKLARLVANKQDFCTWLSTEIPKPLLLQSTLFNTSFLRRLDPWSDRLILDDWPTFLRAGHLALAEDMPIRFTPEIQLTRYRIHDGGLHANIDRQKRACLQVVEEVIPLTFQSVARVNVLSEFALVDLSQGKFLQAWRGYKLAVASHPNLSTVLRMPIALISGVMRRIRRIIIPHR